jgi:hypothetical protein
MVSLMLTNNEIRTLCRQFDTRNFVEIENVWQKLKPEGERIVPFLIEAYGYLNKWQGRVTCVFHLIKYVRTRPEVVLLGIGALKDRATLVRYRACMLLAESQDIEAIPYLKKLLDHSDVKTAEDAAAAIDAIKNRNRHYFIDRAHTGQMFMGGGSPENFIELIKEKSKPNKPWWKFW